MKSEGQVRHQLKQVLYRHLQKRLRANFKKRPHTCVHNREVPLESHVRVALCGHIKRQGLVCDARVTVETAKECPFWEGSETKQEVQEGFRSLIESGDRGKIAAEYPDAMALLWVLDAEDVKEALDEAIAGDGDLEGGGDE